VVIHTIRAYAYGGATETERVLARDAASYAADAAYAAYAAYAAADAAYAAAAADASYAAAYADAAAYAAVARVQSKMRTGEALIRHIIKGE
jgi:hypothetical protein